MTAHLASALAWLARAALCLAFVYSGFAKILDWPGALAEQGHFGLNPRHCSPRRRSSCNSVARR